jgi:MFS family permease
LPFEGLSVSEWVKKPPSSLLSSPFAGALIVPFDILAEFMPSSHRGRFSMFISYFWTIGSVFVASFAWILLSRGYSWRILVYVTAAPVALSSIASILYLPESPRWLVVQGRHKEAQEVI